MDLTDQGEDQCPVFSIPRSALEATPYYHCIARWVRCAYLCGTDSNTGQNYEQRRQWIEEKLLELADIFALDICAYAIMSNHYHVVLHIDNEQADNWNMKEVIDRWHRLFSGNLLSQAQQVAQANHPGQQAACIRNRYLWISIHVGVGRVLLLPLWWASILFRFYSADNTPLWLKAVHCLGNCVYFFCVIVHRVSQRYSIVLIAR